MLIFHILGSLMQNEHVVSYQQKLKVNKMSQKTTLDFDIDNAVDHYFTNATTSISTSTSFGSLATSTHERAGL
jgi:hypothetical protein